MSPPCHRRMLQGATISSFTCFFLIKLQSFLSSKMLNLAVMSHSQATIFQCFKINVLWLFYLEITQRFLQYKQQLHFFTSSLTRSKTIFSSLTGFKLRSRQANHKISGSGLQILIYFIAHMEAVPLTSTKLLTHHNTGKAFVGERSTKNLVSKEVQCMLLSLTQAPLAMELLVQVPI